MDILHAQERGIRADGRWPRSATRKAESSWDKWGSKKELVQKHLDIMMELTEEFRDMSELLRNHPVDSSDSESD